MIHFSKNIYVNKNNTHKRQCLMSDYFFAFFAPPGFTMSAP